MVTFLFSKAIVLGLIGGALFLIYKLADWYLNKRIKNTGL